VGGVLFGPGGHIESTFAWNLGTTINNQAEAYALICGLFIAKKKNVSSLTIVGDSCVIIRYLNSSSLPNDYCLCAILHRIHMVHKDFLQVFPRHVRRHPNSNSDQLENIGVNLPHYILETDGIWVNIPPPSPP
jgi:ribonuclease HI